MTRATMVLIGMLLTSQAAAVTTGHDLLRYCSRSGSESTFNDGLCRGYIRAITDVMFNYPLIGLQACFPANATEAQFARISVKFLREHPGLLHLSAYNNVASALLLAFPCKR